MSATVLVHEGYLKLVRGSEGLQVSDARHFHRLVCRAMEQALVSYARLKQADKRGGAASRVFPDLEILEAPFHTPLCSVVDLHEALEEFQAHSPRASEVLRLRFFERLTVRETADVVGCSEATVERDTELAKAKLRLLLEEDSNL